MNLHIRIDITVPASLPSNGSIGGRKQGDGGFTEMQNFENVFQQAEKKRAASKFNEAAVLYLKARGMCEDKEEELSCLLSLGDCWRMI